MGYHRDAARLFFCTSSPLAHLANGSRSYSKLALQTARSRPAPASSSRLVPSSQRHITNAAKRTSQQAAAAKKDDEPEEQSDDPPQEQQHRTQLAQDFLTGPSPSRQQATRTPRNPLRDTSTSNNTTRPNPFSPTDIAPEISQRFSFLRDHPPPPGQSTATTAKDSEKARENTFQTLLSTFNQHRTAQPRKSNNRANSSRMLAPPVQQNDLVGRDLMRSRAEADLSPPSFVLGVRLPKTVEVNHKRGVDLGRAFNIMETRLRANNVKSDVFKQRFHERPGLKRKRLASVRWRRRFKDGLKETVGRIQEIRKQGW